MPMVGTCTQRCCVCSWEGRRATAVLKGDKPNVVVFAIGKADVLLLYRTEKDKVT